MSPRTDLHSDDASPSGNSSGSTSSAAKPGDGAAPVYEFWPAERQAAAAKAGLRLTVDGEVATVVLDRPAKRNAMTPSMWWQLAEIGRALPGSVRAALLCAEGPSFSAGLDRSVLVGEQAVAGKQKPKTLIDLATSDPVDAELTIEA